MLHRIIPRALGAGSLGLTLLVAAGLAVVIAALSM